MSKVRGSGVSWEGGRCWPLFSGCNPFVHLGFVPGNATWPKHAAPGKLPLLFQVEDVAVGEWDALKKCFAPNQYGRFLFCTHGCLGNKKAPFGACWDARDCDNSFPHSLWRWRGLPLILVQVQLPQLGASGTALGLPRPSACAHAGGAVDVVELVGFVGFLPGGW